MQRQKLYRRLTAVVTILATGLLSFDCYRTFVSNPREARELRDQGWKLTRSGQHEKALSYLDRALALDNRDPRTWSRRAYTLYLLERNEEALKAYDCVYP